MSINRIIILCVALLAGVAAFFLMMDNEGPKAPQQIVKQVKEETVKVLVAKSDLVRGDRFTNEDTKWETWPQSALQPTFITDKNTEGRDSLEGAIARSLIVTGEPIVEAKLVRPDSSGLMSALLSPGMRAVTVRVTAETASGGFILPGDRVDAHYTENTDNDEVVISTLRENVRVLAVNTTYAENGEEANIDSRTITLELSPEDAEYFMLARNSNGTIQLTLRSIFEPETAAVQKGRGDLQVIRYGRS